MKIAIIQKEILAYRVPFYEALSKEKALSLSLYVINDTGESYRFPVNSLPSLKLFDFISFGNTSRFKHYDLIVFPFDLHWLTLYWFLFFYPKKTVLWGHGLGKSKSLLRLRARLIERSAGYIAYEESELKSYKSNGVEKTKLAYSGNTLDVKNAGFSEGGREYFLYVGRLTQRKRVEALIDAVIELRRQGQAVTVFIVGDGQCKDALCQKVAKANLSENVLFYDTCLDQEKLKQFFSKAIAYVSPGHVGLGVLHAFAYGVPVITYDVPNHAPEQANIINDQTGNKVQDSIAALAECMAYYISAPAERERKSKNAYQRYITQRSMPLMVQRFNAALEQFSQ